jgi:hypothetical protein
MGMLRTALIHARSRATALVWLREIAENPFTDEELEELDANNLL